VKCKDEGLPELTSPSSKSVPVKAIELTNAQVEKLAGHVIVEDKNSQGTCPEI